MKKKLVLAGVVNPGSAFFLSRMCGHHHGRCTDGEAEVNGACVSPDVLDIIESLEDQTSPLIVETLPPEVLEMVATNDAPMVPATMVFSNNLEGYSNPLILSFWCHDYPPAHGTLLTSMGNTNPSHPMAFLLFHARYSTTWRSVHIKILHNISCFPTIICLPTKWDLSLSIFMGDVVGVHATTV